MRLLAARDRIARPWKNGGGVTRDVAIAPPEADLDTFDWRISFADVATDGPFSSFAGVDRTLTVVEGEGIALKFGEDERILRRGEPFAFPGDVDTSSRLLAGPIVDLNVMTRRGALTHRVRALPAIARTLRSAAPASFLVCGAGAARLEGSGGLLRLGRFDVADVSGFEAHLTPDAKASLYLIEILTGRTPADA